MIDTTLLASSLAALGPPRGSPQAPPDSPTATLGYPPSAIRADASSGLACTQRGLRAAAKLIADGKLDEMVRKRYAGFDSTAIGKKFAAKKATLAELAAHAKKGAEPKQTSGKQETCESVFNRFAYGN